MASMNPLRVPSGKAFQSAPPSSTPTSGAQPSEPGDGTQQAGYVTPDLGPFECDNCSHFQAPNACDHPQVVSDPEVNGQVDPKGCCNFFKSLSGGKGANPQDSTAGEATADLTSDGNPGGYGS
jgi:hypothetical protein